MLASIKAKQSAIREEKLTEEISRRQTEMNRRNGFEEVVYPAQSIDISATEKEIARLQVG